MRIPTNANLLFIDNFPNASIEHFLQGNVPLRSSVYVLAEISYQRSEWLGSKSPKNIANPDMN